MYTCQLKNIVRRFFESIATQLLVVVFVFNSGNIDSFTFYSSFGFGLSNVYNFYAVIDHDFPIAPVDSCVCQDYLSSKLDIIIYKYGKTRGKTLRCKVS